MAALSSLPPLHLTNLTNTILSSTRRHHRRLTFLLSSPSLFSLTLHHLHTLSLQQKTLLISRHLLSYLHLLTQSNNPTSPLPPPISTSMRERDTDAVLLLLLFCETHKHNPEALTAPFSHWRLNLNKIFSNTLLTLGYSSAPSLGACFGSVLIPFIETVSRCWRLVGVLGCEEGKEVKEVAASAATVVSLPAVEVSVGGRECVICKEEMQVGRDVCELPCQHSFHWMCILPWLGKRNTCPCCRFRLPSDDVFGEIQRLWEVLVKTSAKHNRMID